MKTSFGLNRFHSPFRAGAISFIVLLFAVFSFTACDKTDIVPAGSDSLSLKKFHDAIKKSLDGNCVGYGFVISYKGYIQLPYCDAGGQKRTATNPPAATFGIMDPINIASVSKEITTVAVIKAMAQAGVGLDDKISSYLPSGWVKGTNISAISFRQLLTHTSGIRTDGVAWADLKTVIAGGINLADQAEQQYKNANFALFRYIVPNLLGKHPQTDQQYGSEFLKYCQAVIFDPLQMTDVQAKSTGDDTQALSYSFPAGNFPGTDWGDNSLVVGSQGYNLSAWQLAVFQNKLWYTTELLSEQQQNMMRENRLGLWNNGTVHNTNFWGHNGYFPYVQAWTQGQLWAEIMHFDNGVDVAVIVNSPIHLNGETDVHIQTVLTNAYSASF